MNTELPKLPKLPEPVHTVIIKVSAIGSAHKAPGKDYYTAGHMRVFAEQAIAADRALQDARHREELAAYELTVANLRAAQGAPDGWVLVPVQPSIAACINGSDAVGRVVDGYQCADVYRAMLAAAPAPQPVAQPERGQIVVTKNEAGQIVAVTRQDEDGKILKVIATSMQF